MKKAVCLVFGIFLFLVLAGVDAYPQQKYVYNCKHYIQNWDIPEWSTYKEDHISPILSVDENFKKNDNSSLKLTVAFPGESWSAGVVEAEGIFDLTLYRALTCRVYVPRSAPKGIEARFIIVTGEDYLWLEMDRPVAINPGKQTTVTANLKYGNHGWKSGEGRVRMSDELKEDIRKVAIRIESNIVEYEGPVYIDNIKLVK